MKTHLFTFIRTVFVLSIFAHFSIAQDLSSAQKKEWRKELNKMQETDQYYRVMMVENPQFDNDTIWRLQTISDSMNKQKFVELTKKYGYPTYERVREGGAIALILHFTLENDFLELKDLFKSELEKGNMPPKEYAWWFDRCQRNQGLPIYFGQYTNDDFCGEQLELFNKRRKEIGLEELVKGVGCE